MSLVTVFISCNNPARIAGKISPIEATRYVGASYGNGKKVKHGYDRTSIKRMAFVNLFRNRRKTAVAIVSISLALILFNIVFTFAHSFDVNKMLEKYMYGDFLIADESYLNIGNAYMTETHSLTKETLEKVAGLDGVMDVAKVYYNYYVEPPGDDGLPIPIQQIYGLDDYSFDRLEENVMAGKFDREKFLSGNYAIIGADSEKW